MDFVEIEIEFEAVVEPELELPAPLVGFLNLDLNFFLVLNDLTRFNDFRVGIILTTVVAQY